MDIRFPIVERERFSLAIARMGGIEGASKTLGVSRWSIRRAIIDGHVGPKVAGALSACRRTRTFVKGIAPCEERNVTVTEKE